MQKLEELVASMDFHDQKTFLAYLESPYFTTSKALKSLFRQTLKQLTGADKQEKAFVAMSEIMKKQDLRYLQTDLTRHLEYFFALRHLNKQPFQLDLLKMQALSERDCEKTWNYVEQKQGSNQEIMNFDFHLAGLISGENRVSYHSKKQARKKSLDFKPVMHHLDAFYLAKKLQLFCEMINMKSLLAGDPELIFFDEVKIQSLNYIHLPAVSVYYHLLLTLTEPDNETHFERVRSVITENKNLFPAKELNEIFFYIKNYCIRKINQGKSDYFEVLFSIYKEVLNNKKLMSLDYLSQFEFKNIVSLSLRLKEYDWCDSFIDKFISSVAPEHRKNTFTYNSAYYKFMTGDFKKAVRLLQEVEFTDVVYQLDSRIVLLKCYFEMQDDEAFFYHSSAFRLFLLRNRFISEYQKTINRNLIKHLTAIMRNRFSDVKLKKVKEEILKEMNVADVNWLKKKLEEANS